MKEDSNRAKGPDTPENPAKKPSDGGRFLAILSALIGIRSWIAKCVPNQVVIGPHGDSISLQHAKELNETETMVHDLAMDTFLGAIRDFETDESQLVGEWSMGFKYDATPSEVMGHLRKTLSSDHAALFIRFWTEQYEGSFVQRDFLKAPEFDRSVLVNEEAAIVVIKEINTVLDIDNDKEPVDAKVSRFNAWLSRAA